MTKERHHLLPPENYLKKFEGTNEYIGLLTEGSERSAALGRVARMFAEGMASRETETVEQQLDRCLVNILSSLPDFVQAQHALDKNEEDDHIYGHNTLTYDEKKSHKHTVTAYNIALRELVDTAPDITVEEIKRFTFNAMLMMGTPYEAKYSAQETQLALSGIQHEIGLEQILWQIENVEDVTHGDEFQEHLGIDLLVNYRGNTLALDVKASAFSAQKTLERRNAYMKRRKISEAKERGGYPVWSGLETADFGGGFRISNELAAAKAPQLEAFLSKLLATKARTA